MIRLIQNSLSRLQSFPSTVLHSSKCLSSNAAFISSYGSLHNSVLSRPSHRLATFSPLFRLNDDLKYGAKWEPFQRSLLPRCFHTNNFAFGKYDKDKDPSLAWMRDGKVYDKGPDQILPSTAVRSWHRHGAVRLKIEDNFMANLKPMSVPSLLKRSATLTPNKVAMMVKRDNEWKKWTFPEYLREVRTCAKAFIALGLQPLHSVCILGVNAPEWLISDMGAIFAGGLAAGIYATNTPEACLFCATDSEANIFVVEDDEQLDKILSIRDKLPHLKAIIQYSGTPFKNRGVYSWEEMMTLGGQQSSDLLEARLRNIAVNQCSTLIYTSGTTGNPKGVMLTHDNLTWMARVSQQWAGYNEGHLDPQEVVVSFLPLSHVAAQMSDVYCTLAASGCVAFADKNALKGTLVENMKEIKPTKFLGVPRVWETMHFRITEVGKTTKGFKKAAMTWARSVALQRNLLRMNGIKSSETYSFKLANALILSRVREALGFSRCDFFLCGAAPLSPEIIKFFMSLNIVITEGYGMSETSGPHSMGIPNSYRLRSVGKTMDGCVTKVDNADEYGDGEILMGGRHVTMGYLHLPEKTIQAIDDEGWVHSEDIGRVDGDGFLFITGRLKEIIITAGGENVAPVPIEDCVKSELPAVSQVVVLGDKKKFLAVLITLKTEVDPNSQKPMDILLPQCKEWIEKNGACYVNTIQDVISELDEKKNQNLIRAIELGISRANVRAISKAARIKKWVILPTDFSMPGGEIGPTLKLKREVVYRKYKDVISKIYEEK